MDLYSYINNYSQNQPSLEIPRLGFQQAHLVKYLVFWERILILSMTIH
jgi:hypothetical protein